MRLEAIAVNLRVRTPYESIDLGYRMVMAWRRDVFSVWASVYLGAGLIINLLCFAKPILALFILWWLKPAFDRVILHVLSGAAFGAAPSVADTWRQLPKLWLNNGLLRALTIGRFDLARSFSLPVTQLERQFGKPARLRRQVLGREARGAASWLTIISMHFEILIALSAYVFIDLLMPSAGDVFDLTKWLLQTPTIEAQYVSNIVSMLTVLVLEPFYVAAGFALYLNTRTVLEGWDIELAFKRMNARLTDAAKVEANRAQWDEKKIFTEPSTALNATTKKVASVCAAALLLCTATFVTPTANAQAATENTPNTGARERAKLILDDPAFGETRKTWSIKYVGPGAEQKPQKVKKYPWLESLGVFIGQLLRVIAWVLGGILVIALVVLLVKQLEKSQWRLWLSAKAARAEVLFGLDVRAESLPDDVAASANAMLARGDMRAALSLLYRGALVFLIDDGAIDIARGDTEGMCVRNVARQYDKSRALYFAALVNAWQRVAYAGNANINALPSDDEVRLLIAAWAGHFQIRQRDQNQAAIGQPA
jgi:hypothetical protein